MNWRSIVLKSISLLTMAVLFLGVAHTFDRVQSADLTNASVTLSTPQFSYLDTVNGAHAAGSTIIEVNGSPQNLFNRDTVTFDPLGTPITETVLAADEDDTSFSLVDGLDALVADGTVVTAPRTTELKIHFSTASAVTDGQFKIRIPAHATPATAADGVPDTTGWDAGGTVSITCPTGAVGDYTFAAGTGPTTSGGYHTFVCSYTGAGGLVDFDGTSGEEITISGLINPAPNGGTEGEADAYSILIDHETSGGASVVDQSAVSVAVIESVKVTASVQPQITFSIAGVAQSTDVCGYGSTSITTNPFEVEFGDLLTSAFKTAAQQLTVSTNAGGGYVVTAIAGDQLHRDGVTCSNADGDSDGDGIADPESGCIPDSVGDGSQMDYNIDEEWSSTSVKGFAYTLQGGSSTTPGEANEPVMEFESNLASTGGGSQCNGASGSCHRQFPDQQSTEPATDLFSNTGPVSGDTAYVCYKAIIDEQQEAGNDYETDITYRATATF